MTTDTPSNEERAKFLFNQTMHLVGYTDAIDTGLGNDFHAPGRGEDVDEFVRNLEASLVEGIEKKMQNSREHGYSPITAFEKAIDTDWPDWFLARIAESQHQIFSGGMLTPDEMDEDRRRYLEALEEDYDVPR